MKTQVENCNKLRQLYPAYKEALKMSYVNGFMLLMFKTKC